MAGTSLLPVDYLRWANWSNSTFNFYNASRDSSGVLYLDSLEWDILERPVRSLNYQSKGGGSFNTILFDFFSKLLDC